MPDSSSLFATAAGGALAQQMAAIRARHTDTDPDMVADVVRAVLTSMAGDLSGREMSLLTEVEDLGRTIAKAKAEIAAVGVDDINASHIPSATDELDAIVAHTASATEAILECCEILDTAADSADKEIAAKLTEVTTRIYEACGFQDITGQRITKVVATLKAIETKVAHIVLAFGNPDRPSDALLPPLVDSALLNGPQLPAQAMDQSDIDKLLASFE